MDRSARWSAIYDPVDPSEPYWAGRPYFGGADRAAPEPAFVAEPTLELVEHDAVAYTADLIAGPDTFAPTGIETLRDDLGQLRLRMTALRATVTTDMPGAARPHRRPTVPWSAGSCRSRPCR